VMKKMGLDKVPLYENASPERTKYRRQVEEMGKLRNGPTNSNRVEVKDAREMTKRIKARALELGADLVGVTRLRPLFIDLGIDIPHKNIITVGVHEDYEKVIEGPRAVESEAHKAYYMVALIATKLATHIRELGYPALAHHNGGTNIQAIPAMYHAGFGELGKHGSLINPTYGASFRPSFVTTDLPLEMDQPYEFGVQSYCESCKLCANNCPGDAIPNDYILTEGIKRWLTDVEKCYPYSRLRKEYCHLCVDVCPYNAPLHKETYKTFMRGRKTEGYKTPKHST
ncbi:MAG: 4Fe-4S dicluster domain-containing protein, partial [Candidatus Binatia bacterium]